MNWLSRTITFFFSSFRFLSLTTEPLGYRNEGCSFGPLHYIFFGRGGNGNSTGGECMSMCVCVCVCIVKSQPVSLSLDL